MTADLTIDTARLPLLLTELRLPTIARLWPEFARRADKEGWPAARVLAALLELEIAERAQRRLQRHLQEARPGGSPAARQDARHLRLHRRADPQQGPRQRARRR